MVLIVVSTVAALVVVIALVGATAIDTWWSLAAVMVVHVLMTIAVFSVVAFVLSGHSGRRRRGALRTGTPPAA
jgi:hypothetical protein